MSQRGGSTRTVLIALTVNVLVAAGKGVGGVISGSGALLSEAAHSVADTINEVLLLTALRRGDRPADEQHPFGYGKERFFWSLLAAVGIFVAGAMFAFFEGYRTLSEPQQGSPGFIAPYVALGFAAALEGTSWLRAVRQVSEEARAHGRGIIEYIRSSDDPTVKTVASEDSVALIGVLIAFMGILLHQLTTERGLRRSRVAAHRGDARLRRVRAGPGQYEPAHRRGRHPDVRRRLAEELRSFDEIDEVVDLQTMRIGTRRPLVAARLDFGQRLSSDQIEQLSTRIEQRLHDHFPQIDQIFLDATDPSARERRIARESARPWSYPASRAGERQREP